MGLLKRIFNKKSEKPKEPIKKTTGSAKEQNSFKPVETKKSEPKTVKTETFETDRAYVKIIKEDGKPPIRIITDKEIPSDELTELDRLKIKQSQFVQHQMADEDYYWSDEAKEDAHRLKAELRNYLDNHPKDYVIRGAELYGCLWEYTDRIPIDEKEILRLIGMGYYHEKDLNDYPEAIKIYNKALKLTWDTIGDELEELIEEHGEGDYLYVATIKQRIRVCENIIHRAKVKELEAEAKALEETNPKEAIKKYEELNEINPNLKKYNKRIYRMMELEAKELEATDPLEAVKIYAELNVLNPGLKKYNKRIEIIKRKLQ